MGRLRWGQGVAAALGAAFVSSAVVACFFSVDPPKHANDAANDGGVDVTTPTEVLRHCRIGEA